MQSQKRHLEDQDPDYEIHEPDSYQSKRQKMGNDDGQDYCERIRKVIQNQFELEIDKREEQVMECQDRLFKARQNLRLLRYAITASYYKAQPAKDQSRIHPAVKKLLGSRKTEEVLIDIDVPESLRTKESTSGEQKTKAEVVLSKTPCYKAPIEKPGSLHRVPSSGRSLQGKVKRSIVVGNVSKWIPPDFRDDDSTHKWMIYVRGPPDVPDVSNVVERVRFFLHSSYKPHDVIEIKEAPFHLSRRGWGEFPVRVQIHFSGPQNRPIDVIHQLALDKTYSGLQTLGGETLVDVWLVEGVPMTEKQLPALEKPSPVKSEPESVHEDPIASVNVESNPVTAESCPPAAPISPPKLKLVEAVRKDGVPQQVIIPSLSKSTFTLPSANSRTVVQKIVSVRKIGQPTTRPGVVMPKGTLSLMKPVVLKSEAGAKRVIFLKMNGNGKLIPVIAPAIHQNVAKVQNHQAKAVLPKICTPGGTVRTVVAAPSQFVSEDKKNFEEQYRRLSVKFSESIDVTTFSLLKNLPLIDEKYFNNQDYVRLHPYIIPSEKAFLAMALGKQRAHELLRAKEICRCLEKHGFESKNAWKVVQLSRAYGFTPKTNCSRNAIDKSVPSKVYTNRYSEDSDVINWLTSNSNNPKERDQEEVIDIESISPSKSKTGNLNKGASQLVTEQCPEGNFIQSVAKKIGISFVDEDTNKNDGEAELVLYQGVLQLMEELLRRSYLESSKRGDSNSITLTDVHGALQQRKEFDVFRNDGLGTELEK
ncbi:YEATS domain-containing protein 2 [Neocloeon triangulifer]|uniref:YEATS domain-containing protein 2 n=1 Tax=Neocloeon triangulifer TaxID=2078957 RepID=UPI00286FA6F9|nr:YEATS domain-containing protein 2 [Neocloeon triangulifer]